MPRHELGRWAAALYRVCGGRRMHTENLHITLAFIGQVDAARLDDIVAAARSVQARSFMLRVDQPGYWKHNRIAWLGASQVPAELEAMVAELRSALEASRIPFDPKPFVAHVTLLRNARPPSDEWPALAVVHWPVSGFSLVSSERDASGTHYRVAWRSADA